MDYRLANALYLLINSALAHLARREASEVEELRRELSKPPSKYDDPAEIERLRQLLQAAESGLSGTRAVYAAAIEYLSEISGVVGAAERAKEKKA